MYRTSTVSLFFLLLTFTLTITHAAVTTSRKPKTYYNVETISQACPNIQQNRICDPDQILSPDTKDVSAALHQLETNHPLTCNQGTTISDTQMAIVIVNRIDMNGKNHYDDDYKIRSAKHLAMALHDQWGVGNTSCFGSGLLLLLSIQDRVVYLSTSPGMMTIMTSNRIDSVINDMKSYLREEEYNQAIVKAIQLIQNYIDRGPPSFFERNAAFLIIGSIVSAIVFCAWSSERKRKEYVKVQTELNKLDQAKALSLMGQYKCTSCPICFHDFEQVKNDFKNKEKESPPPSSNCFLGCDDLPIQLLRCGHAFCQTCFQDWTKSGSRITHQCPVCKQDIGQRTSSTSDSLTFDPRSRGPVEIQPLVFLQNELYNQPSYRNDNYGRSRMERNFRIHRLHHRYPRYVNQGLLHRWTDDGYDGNLAEDQTFVNMRPPEPSTQQHHSGNNGGGNSFSSFGGGSSGGGGGGTW